MPAQRLVVLRLRARWPPVRLELPLALVLWAVLAREREAVAPPPARLPLPRRPLVRLAALDFFSPPRGRMLKDFVELCRAPPVRVFVLVAIINCF